jgi:hypothetical protein
MNSVADAAAAAFLGMTAGMLLGMILGTWLAEKAIAFGREVVRVPRWLNMLSRTGG